ncbi:TonB-dependent siderophore receptor [Nitrobacter sp.]|uniref:TonB-dependent siderophore receptor n=1 Tax=Nitrobacter sp. TaxID=29420 RepID=UPI0029CAC536|nr:TonB-dependent siderophore receptor [Nitrobacter sp.]
MNDRGIVDQTNISVSSKGGRRKRLAGALLGSTILAYGAANAPVIAPAQAQQTARTVQFSIPAQPLSSAVDAFSRVTGWQVGYSSDIARSTTTRAVSGAMTPAQALQTMVAGTGVKVSITGPASAALVSGTANAGSGGANVAGAIALDTIDIQGETAWGPVNGFVASRSATATKTDTPLIEVPASVSVVTRDQIQTRQVQSLNETLKYTAGVYAETNGYQTGSPAFQMRGFDSRENEAIYLNGLRGVRKSDIEPYGLERVEVMRGPASVLYGQNAPGGVIALVTKLPTANPIREVQLQGGSFDQKGGAFDFSGPVTDDRTLLYRFTGLLRDGGNGIDFSKDKRAFLSGALTWRPTVATEITAYSLYQKDEGRWNYGLPAQGTVLPNPYGRIPLTRFIGEPSDYERREWTTSGYKFEHHATDSLTFRQNLQYTYEDWDIRSVYPSGLQSDWRTLDRAADSRHYTWDTFAIDNQAELKATSGTLHHTLLFGADYRWRQGSLLGSWGGTVDPIDVFAPVYGSPVVIPAANYYGSRQTENFTGIYLQDQIKLDQWILTLGGRYDWVDNKTVGILDGSITNQNNSAFTKRAGLGYEFDSGVVPYISYSESFMPVSGMTFDGAPFKPETGKQYEAGVKYQPKDMNLRITAAVYDLRRQNVTTIDPAHPFFSIQTGEVTSRGFEFEAVTSLSSGLNLTAAYAYNDARVTESNDGNLGMRQIQAPQHLASIWADYAIRDGALNGLTLGGGVRYVGASAGDFMNTFYAPAYTVVDAMARYDIDNWRFSVNVNNLFDNQYVARCISLAQCNVGRFRTVLGRVSYRW